MKHLDLAIWAAYWNAQHSPAAYFPRYRALLAAAYRLGWEWTPIGRLQLRSKS